jgi:hypothetical protein
MNCPYRAQGPMIETPSTREIAEFFKMLLAANWIDKPTIIAWADATLVSQAEPDPALIDLSLSANQVMHEVFSSLEQVRGAHRVEIPARMIFGYADREYALGRKTSGEIAPKLFVLFHYGVDASLPEEIARDVVECDYLSYCISMTGVTHSVYDPADGFLRDAVVNLWKRWLSVKDNPTSDLSRAAQRERRLEDNTRQLDQKLREVLEWGRPYRDLLPAQCFPPDSAP